MNEMPQLQPITEKKFKAFPFFAMAGAVLMFLAIVVTNLNQRTGDGTDYSIWLFVPSAILVFLAAVSALRNYRQSRWITAPLLISVPILIVQTVLVAIRLNQSMPPELFTAYLSSILLVHGMTIMSTVVAFNYRTETYAQGLSFQTPFARLSLAAAFVTFISLATGVFVTLTRSAQVCEGWLLCNGWALPQSLGEWLHVIHRGTVGLSGILIAWLVYQAWRRQRSSPAVLTGATASGILFFAQALIGAALVARNFPLDLVGLHTATAAASWAMLIVLVVHVGLAGRSAVEEELDLFQTQPWQQRARDFLALTKPVIVLLLLVTTFTGMVVGAKAIPPFSIIFWTLVGGALAAGGSGAINQYIDRNLDKLMKRTAQRPLPANRLTPAEGLAFGIALCLISFYLLAVFTNLLAALLAVAGMFYYVWVYSMLLKRTTVQNIVIGGGAGAIPPLVGWAAATGELTLASLMLFIIIFFWTPPHFWALALVRIKEYARGGVPMLPVVHGELETRKQILIYTIELVILTLVAPFVGIGSWLYIAGAVLLGGGMLWLAWRIWRDYTPKLAYRMYRYSSMYLAILFVVLVIDALVFA